MAHVASLAVGYSAATAPSPVGVLLSAAGGAHASACKPGLLLIDAGVLLNDDFLTDVGGWVKNHDPVPAAQFTKRETNVGEMGERTAGTSTALATRPELDRAGDRRSEGGLERLQLAATLSVRSSSSSSSS